MSVQIIIKLPHDKTCVRVVWHKREWTDMNRIWLETSNFRSFPLCKLHIMGISHSSSALLENLSQNFKALIMLNSDEHEIKTVPKYRDKKKHWNIRYKLPKLIIYPVKNL